MSLDTNTGLISNLDYLYFISISIDILTKTQNGMSLTSKLVNFMEEWSSSAR